MNTIQLDTSISRYPSDSVLLTSYKGKTQWNVFKRRIVERSLEFCKDQARRRYIKELKQLIASQHTSSSAHDSQIITSLKNAQNIDGNDRATPVAGENALKTPDIVDPEDFQSRSMLAADANSTLNNMVMNRRALSAASYKALAMRSVVTVYRPPTLNKARSRTHAPPPPSRPTTESPTTQSPDTEPAAAN